MDRNRSSSGSLATPRVPELFAGAGIPGLECVAAQCGVTWLEIHNSSESCSTDTFRLVYPINFPNNKNTQSHTCCCCFSDWRTLLFPNDSDLFVVGAPHGLGPQVGLVPRRRAAGGPELKITQGHVGSRAASKQHEEATRREFFGAGGMRIFLEPRICWSQETAN